jgi:predicted transcriptional regulator
MKSELKLLKILVKQPTTRITEAELYSLAVDADVKDLLQNGYIKEEQIISDGIKHKYYKIGIKGFELLKKREDTIRQYILS